MATTKFYLDTRRAKADGTYPLKVMINSGNTTILIPLNIHLQAEQWNANTLQITSHSNKQFLNSYIIARKSEIERLLLTLSENGTLHNLAAQRLKQYIESALTPGKEPKRKDLFAAHFTTFISQKNGRTREIYQATYNHLQRFARDLNTLTFNDITKTWLVEFDKYLQHYSPSQNARNIHLRNIRAVFNDAIDNELTTNYPFRKFSIKNEETAKRSLSVEQLRTLFTYPCEEWQQPYVDMYKLIFFLCGINIIDLFNLKEIVNGRIEYSRAKTHKLYSIKVEPEAMAIIEKYKGKKALLNMADRYTNYKDYAQRLNNTIMHIGEYKRVGRGGKKVYTPLFPNITTYYMRHTWATIAAELDIPFDTISLALGHSAGGARVTQVYINFNRKKIDEANRKVIDYVLYGK